MQLLSFILVTLSSTLLASAQSGFIDLSPADNAKLITDLKQYIPEKRNRFHWEIYKPDAKACSCADAICPTTYGPQSVRDWR